MKNISLIVSFLLLFITNAFAQSDHEKDSLKFVMKYTVSKQQFNSLNYKGTIDKKKALSAVLDKTKYFEVFAKKNLANTGYQYDWLISENKGGDNKRILLFKDDDFFEILEGEKRISVLENIGKLDPNSDAGILRSLLLPDELIFGLTDKDKKSSTTFEDDGEFFKMYNQEQEDLLRIVCYNKQTLFPESADVIQSYPNMTALDITSVRLSDVRVNEVFADSTLSMKKYLNRGFTVNFIGEKTEDKTDVKTVAAIAVVKKPVIEFNQTNVNTMLKTELQTGKGWETTIGQFHDKEYLLLDFWHASSPISMDDLHTVQSLHRDFRKKGLRVFGVNCKDFNEKKTVVKKLKQKGITFTSFFGKRINLKKWNVETIPSYVLLDGNGKIVLQGGSEVLSEIRGYLNGVN